MTERFDESDPLKSGNFISWDGYQHCFHYIFSAYVTKRYTASKHGRCISTPHLDALHQTILYEKDPSFLMRCSQANISSCCGTANIHRLIVLCMNKPFLVVFSYWLGGACFKAKTMGSPTKCLLQDNLESLNGCQPLPTSKQGCQCSQGSPHQTPTLSKCSI